MEKLTATDSLKVIQSVIELRKKKYEENGLMLLFWGALVVIAGLIQFVMIQMGKGAQSGWAWLLTMIPGFIITFILSFSDAIRKVKNQETPDYFGWAWAFVGLLAILNGMIFGRSFGVGFTVAIFLPFCIIGLISGINIKNKLWIIMSLLGTVITYSTLFIPFGYHPLLSAFISFVLFVIPGLNLYISYKRNQNV